MSGAVSFVPAAFREAFPAFADALSYPDAMLLRHYQGACCHVSPVPGKRLNGESLVLALHLMTAHLAHLERTIEKGDSAALVSSATIDKVSVSLTPPPLKSQFGWWLSLTPYGAQLLALLKSKSAGGLYVGGSPAERGAFRKAGGVFVNGKAHS